MLRNVEKHLQEWEKSENVVDLLEIIGFCFANVDLSRYRDLDDKYESLKSTWILLDAQSNCDIFKNEDLLKDTHEKRGDHFILKSNGDDDIRTSQVGNIRGYGEVWFNEHSMANILFLLIFGRNLGSLYLLALTIPVPLSVSTDKMDR